MLKVYVDADGNFVKGNICSFKQINRGVPVPDYDLGAVETIKELTQRDFPDGQLLIHENGFVEKVSQSFVTERND